MRPHVVDAQDRRAALEGGDGRRDARPEQVVGAGQTAQGALAREADEHRPPERDQHVEPAHELEVVRDRLAEADAGVEADPLLGDALRDREREPLLEERRDLGRDVVVARLRLHRPRLALHVHEAEVRAGVGDDSRELGVAAQSRDVVDEDRAALERGPRDGRLRGVDRDREARRRAGREPARRAAAPPPRRRRPSRAASTRRRCRRSRLPPPTIRLAASTATAGSRWTPPSENESGVTLTTPITDGRGNRSSSEITPET